MREHYNHSRRRVLRRRRMLVAAAAVLLVAAVIFAMVHWVIPVLNKEINPPRPRTGRNARRGPRTRSGRDRYQAGR